MRVLWRRPLAGGAFFFIVALMPLLRTSLPVRLTMLCAAGLVFLTITLYALFRRAWRPYLVVLLWTAGLLFGSLSAHLFVEWYCAPTKGLAGKAVMAEGLVIEREEATSYSAVMRVRLTHLNGERVFMKAELEFSYASALQAGDTFCLEGTVSPTDPIEGIGEEQYLLSRGCLLRISCADEDPCEKTGEKPLDVGVLLSHLNHRLSSRLYHAVGKEAGGLAVALLLGNRSYLSPTTSLAFERTGTTHLLALSGLHVSVLMGFLELVLRKLRLPRRWRLVVIMSAVVLYTALTGFAMSMVRAAIMMLLVGAAFYVAEEYDAFTALMVALAGILGLMPYAVYDLSLWMSFLSAGAIIVFIPLWEWMQELLYDRLSREKRWVRLLASVLSGLFVGLAANLALMLLSALKFGSVSILSIPATILLIPPTSALLILSIPALLFSACPFLVFLPRLLSRVTVCAVEWVSRADGILFPMESTPILVALCIMTISLILLALLYVPKKRAWLFALPLLPAVIAFLMSGFGVGYPREGLHASISKTAGGEVLLLAGEGACVAVDASDGSATGAFLLATMAAEQGCTEIDDLVITRYINKNTYFLSTLLSELRVRRVRLPEPKNDAERAMADRLCEVAETHGSEVIWNFERLAVEDLSCTAYLSTPAVGSIGARVLISFSYRGEEITYLSTSILEEREHRGEADELCRLSEYLIVGSRAAGDKSIQASDTVRAIYLSDADMAEKLTVGADRICVLQKKQITYFSIP